jgi:hypothetical protein
MKKQLTPLMIAHLGLMLLMIAATVVFLVSEKTPAFEEYFGSLSTCLSIMAFVNIAALCCGVFYLLQGYSKNDANFYTTFLALTAVCCAINVYTGFVIRGFGLAVILMIVKVIALGVLALGKDLGKRNSMILLAVMIVIDLIVFFTSFEQSVMTYKLTAMLSKLVADGTVGLAIRGKYDDKDARGSK